MPAILAQHAYGKSRIRLTRVTRLADRHEVRELTVDIQLEGDFEASYTLGDNSGIIPTDTMKNTVYALAIDRPVAPAEGFGMALVRHFLEGFAHVRSASVRLVEKPWERISVDGQAHPHAFVGVGPERRTCTVVGDRDALKVESGIDDLLILKTSGSAFSGFIRDKWTTLAETADRLLGTSLTASWTFDRPEADWDRCHREIRRAMLETFTRHDSLGVQQTLHAMGEAALEACPEVREITLKMPNKHRLLVDMKPFGLENRNEVFVATDEPYGLITGTLRRS
jgi:urate oxidase